MPESEFDPYLKWLGIRDPERPINHYRLLGLDPFENDADVISMAADRQMAHIRTYQNGPKGAHSQNILNELAIARRCLLDPEQKRAYDQKLKSKDHFATFDQIQSSDSAAAVAVRQPTRFGPQDLGPPVAKPVVASIAPVLPAKTVPELMPNFTPAVISVAASEQSQSPPASFEVSADENVRSRNKKREQGRLIVSLVGWLTGGLAGLGAGALILTYVLPSNNNDGGDDNDLGLVVKVAPESGGGRLDSNSNQTDSSKPGDRSSSNSKTAVAEINNSIDSIAKRNGTEQPPANLPSVNDADFPWDLTNLNRYPVPGSDGIQLLAALQSSANQKQTLRFEPSATDVGTDDYENVPAQGGLVIGFVVSRTDGGALKTLRPIFLNSKGPFLGKSDIKSDNKSYVLIARPGYALGEIEYSRLAPMSGFRLTYMKIAKTGLEPKDRYSSQWFGYQDGPIEKPVNPKGLPIIGIYGRTSASEYVASIGLIGGSTQTSTVRTTAEADPPPADSAKPLPSFFADKKPASDPPSLNVLPPPENGTATVENGVRRETPGSKEIKIAEKSLTALYEKQINDAGSPAKLQKFAKLLLTDALASKDQDATIFVMLSESARIATNVGDAKTAVEAIRELDALFEIEYWKMVKTAIDDAAKNSTQLTEADFKKIIDDLILTAIKDEQFEEADWVVGRALKMARRAPDNTVTEFYQRQRNTIKELSDLAAANQRALIALEVNAVDPTANLERGDYLFVVADRLTEAMEFWQKSEDENMKQIVKRNSELDRNEVNSMLALAEAWEVAGGPSQSVKDKKCLERALGLYRNAQVKLDGLERRKLDLKIESLNLMMGN